MSKVCFLLGSVLLFRSLFSLEQAPWLGDVYSFTLHTDFTYSQYSQIDHAALQPEYAYNNYLTECALGVTLSDKIDIQLELEMARTPHQTYGFRSSAIQGRYLLWNDIAGDLVTFALGFNTRAVSGRSVRDVSSPYASYWNNELTFSVGKEFTKQTDWKTRGFILAAIGLANHGSCWNRYDGVFEFRIGNPHSLEVFASSYLGYGSKQTIVIDQFRGWGFISHKSLDLGVKYKYFFDLWGELSISYLCRVLAVSYPKGEQAIEFAYTLPFSFF